MLKKINDRFWTYFHKESNMLFTLEKGQIGLYSAGECYRLFLTYANQKTLIACFTTKDDYHKCYKQTYEGRVCDPYEILPLANRMIDYILE